MTSLEPDTVPWPARKAMPAGLAASFQARLVLAMRWLGVVTPFALIAGPSFADIAGSVLALLFLVYTALGRDFTWVREKWLGLGLLLWACLCVRTALGDNSGKGLLLALPFVRFLIFAAALRTVVLTDTLWRRRLATAGCIALGALALDAMLQYFAGVDVLGRPAFGFRMTAFYHHPWVGAMLSWLYLPVALSFADRKMYGVAAAFGTLCVLAIVLSGDRMALLTTFLALLVLGLLFRQARRVFLIAAPIGLLLLAGILFFNKQVYDRQVSSTIETVQKFPHSQYRVIWGSAIDIVRDHLLFGVGSYGFRTTCPDPAYGPLFPYSDKETRCPAHPHNIFLEWLVETGLVGFGLFLAMLASIVSLCIRRLRQGEADWAYCALFATLLARLWPIASWTSFQHAWSAIPFWLLIGWILAYTPAVTAGAAERSS